MKIKEGYVLRQVADLWVVLPLAEETVNFNGMITLNETGAFLWNLLEQETDEAALVAALLGEYDVDEATAQQSVQRFVGKLRDNGFLD